MGGAGGRAETLVPTQHHGLRLLRPGPGVAAAQGQAQVLRVLPALDCTVLCCCSEVAPVSRLPVTVLAFGDTGTPFDRAEGRVSLGRLTCLESTVRPASRPGPASLTRHSSASSLSSHSLDLLSLKSNIPRLSM